jgi:hypothetical protein
MHELGNAQWESAAHVGSPWANVSSSSPFCSQLILVTTVQTTIWMKFRRILWEFHRVVLPMSNRLPPGQTMVLLISISALTLAFTSTLTPSLRHRPS